MRVSAKILDGIAETVKGLFDVRSPLNAVKAVTKRVPTLRRSNIAAGRRKAKRAGVIKLLEGVEEFAAKESGKHLNRDKEIA